MLCTLEKNILIDYTFVLNYFFESSELKNNKRRKD